MVRNTVVIAARTFAVNTCANLDLLIYTKEGNIRLPEVHEYLRAHVDDPDKLTNDDPAEALEQAGEKYMSPDIIDELLIGIKNRWLLTGVKFSFGFAKRLMRYYPDFILELQLKKGTLLLKFLSHDARTMETHRLLVNRPKLTKFIMEAFMVKMGIPLTANKAANRNAFWFPVEQVIHGEADLVPRHPWQDDDSALAAVFWSQHF